jgi:hypothetical protein
MSSLIEAEAPAETEIQWLAAVVQVEHARQDYAEYLKSPEKLEAESGRLWLRLWLAERRRDELFRQLD